MGWEQYGKVWDDGGEHSDEQVGKAASVRFVNPELPGRLFTVYAYPVGVSHLGEDGDQIGVTGIQSAVEFMICRDIEDPGSTEVWSTYTYDDLDTRPYSGPSGVMIAEAEQDALAWIMRYDPAKFIDWEGERF